MSDSTNGSFRKSLLWLHTWSGLTIGLVVVFLAVTGAGFILRPQLDAVLNRELLVVPTCTERLPLDALADNARAAHPAGKLYSIEVTGDANASDEISGKDRAAYLKILKEEIPMFSTDGRMPVAAAEKEWRVLCEFNPKLQPIDLQKTFTNEFVDEALRKRR